MAWDVKAKPKIEQGMRVKKERHRAIPTAKPNL